MQNGNLPGLRIYRLWQDNNYIAACAAQDIPSATHANCRVIFTYGYLKHGERMHADGKRTIKCERWDLTAPKYSRNQMVLCVCVFVWKSFNRTEIQSIYVCMHAELSVSYDRWFRIFSFWSRSRGNKPYIELRCGITLDPSLTKLNIHIYRCRRTNRFLLKLQIYILD